jgi:hypothetical protein
MTEPTPRDDESKTDKEQEKKNLYDVTMFFVNASENRNKNSYLKLIALVLLALGGGSLYYLMKKPSKKKKKKKK